MQRKYLGIAVFIIGTFLTSHLSAQSDTTADYPDQIEGLNVIVGNQIDGDELDRKPREPVIDCSARGMYLHSAPWKPREVSYPAELYSGVPQRSMTVCRAWSSEWSSQSFRAGVGYVRDFPPHGEVYYIHYLGREGECHSFKPKRDRVSIVGTNASSTVYLSYHHCYAFDD